MGSIEPSVGSRADAAVTSHTPLPPPIRSYAATLGSSPRAHRALLPNMVTAVGVSGSHPSGSNGTSGSTLHVQVSGLSTQ